MRSFRFALLLMLVPAMLAAQTSSAPAFNNNYAPIEPKWGIQNGMWLAISPWDMSPLDSTFTYTYATMTVNTTTRWGVKRTNAGGGSWLGTGLKGLPQGAQILGFEFDFCDTSATDQMAFHIKKINWSGTYENLAADYQSGVATVPGCIGHYIDLTTPDVVDNYNYHYEAEVFFSSTNTSIMFVALRVNYKLQVATAPVSASFTDVPTTHPFYQYIEAVKHDGITGGCTATTYCPNDPITRGQMAVFLAKALGLGW